MRSRPLTIWMMAFLLLQICTPLAFSQEQEKPYSVEELQKLIESDVISDARIVEAPKPLVRDPPPRILGSDETCN